MGLLDVLEEQWGKGEPYRVAVGGLLSGDAEPLMSLLNAPARISPDDILDAALLGPISPLGKAKLIEALRNGGKGQGFELGTLTTGQAKRFSQFLGREAPTSIHASPTAIQHIYDSRVARDGFSPEEVAKFAENALLPRALLSPGNKAGRAQLETRGMVDQLTKRRYDAQLPFDATENGLEAITVIPRGLAGRKTKPTK